MPLHSLEISTRLLLHAEFVKAPVIFAIRHNVDLVGDVFPSTSFKKDPDREDPYSADRTSTDKANIHLVRYGAIRLFTQRDSNGSWVRSIDINPAVLLHGDEDHPLTEGDLVLALSMLMTQVIPLLADPLAARHIIPGLAGDNTHIAYWRKIESEVLLPDIDIRCLHNVSHPDAGPAEGATEERLKLGDRGECVILIKSAKWTAADPRGARKVCGVRVRLSLRGRMLLALFARPNATVLINDDERLVMFRASDVSRVHQQTMSKLAGVYLPVPPEWVSMGKPATHAKTIALLAELTGIPVGELRAMYEAICNPSESTRERLDDDVPTAAAFLKPVPVSSLFQPGADVMYQFERLYQKQLAIDPLLAAAYGSEMTVAKHQQDLCD